MKITTNDNVKDFILDRVQKMCLTFDDGKEVWLSDIKNIDLDLDTIDTSYIQFLSVLQNVELENYFSKKHRITHIHIEYEVVNIENEMATLKNPVFYDIPCSMKMRKLRVNNDLGDTANMYIELEGYVK